MHLGNAFFFFFTVFNDKRNVLIFALILIESIEIYYNKIDLKV